MSTAKSAAKSAGRKLLGAAAGLIGVVFGGVAYDVAVNGTGMEIPRGDDVVEGTLMAGDATEVPTGEPILFGEVRLTQPGSGAVDHSWTAVVGEAQQRVRTSSGEVEVTLPHPREWKGPIEPDHTQVDGVAGLPVVEDADDVTERLGAPPYQLLVTAFRQGDPIIARRAADGRLSEVYPGERATLEAWRDQQEGRRWPIVALMAVMCLSSLMLSWRAWR